MSDPAPLPDKSTDTAGAGSAAAAAAAMSGASAPAGLDRVHGVSSPNEDHAPSSRDTSATLGSSTPTHSPTPLSTPLPTPLPTHPPLPTPTNPHPPLPRPHALLVIDCWQSQSYWALQGWGAPVSLSSGVLLCPHYWVPAFGMCCEGLPDPPPPQDWQWAGPWEQDPSPQFGTPDAEGWHYGPNFPALAESLRQHRGGGAQSTYLVRRRRWLRILHCGAPIAAQMRHRGRALQRIKRGVEGRVRGAAGLIGELTYTYTLILILYYYYFNVLLLLYYYYYYYSTTITLILILLLL
ncbi:hypothetical protein B484DRAFT_129212 [Ochromonadaceae sp. CCMP2298]|nr:hypothetical protein B484DRAFT_129212 [Ochromonadaceae sp. CCMP2298]